MKREEQKDIDPFITGSIGAVTGALIGVMIGIAFSHKTVREKAKEQFDLYKDDGLDVVKEVYKKKSTKHPASTPSKKLLARAN